MSWERAPARIAIKDDEVQVWRASLTHGPACVDVLRRGLSADENERAQRFHFPRDRVRFVAARAFLRRVLGQTLDRDAAGLRFAYGAQGKPSLEGGDVEFNLSHAEDLALCAVACGRAVGVDVEKIGPLKEDGVIGRVFSPEQAARLRALPETERWAQFCAGWTRKEAIVKAHGKGLSLGLDAFDVSLGTGDDVLHDKAGKSWRVRPLSPGAGFQGAVALSGAEPFDVRCFAWRWDCGCA
jgi:4'-phosphopantetheinyl transferase